MNRDSVSSNLLKSIFLDLFHNNDIEFYFVLQCFSRTPQTNNLQQPGAWTITNLLISRRSAGGRGRVWAPHLPDNPGIYWPTPYSGLSSTIVASSKVKCRCWPWFVHCAVRALYAQSISRKLTVLEWFNYCYITNFAYCPIVNKHNWITVWVSSFSYWPGG